MQPNNQADSNIGEAYPEPVTKLTGTLIAAAFFRLALNTARRFVYPFAPVLSRGLNVPLTAITSLIAVNLTTSIFGLYAGPLADRVGYRVMMIAGLAMLALGMSAGGVFPFYWVVMVALFLAGLGKSVYDPAVQAYVGERVPFNRRGLAIGLIEFSWAASTLIGIPLIGLLLDRFGWRAPFFLLGGLGFLGVAVLCLIVPRERKRGAIRSSGAGFGKAFQKLLKERTALGALGFAFFVSIANDNLFVVYGAWLEGSFGLGIVSLGLGTGIIGVAEFLGEGSTAVFADRFGLKRTVITTLFLSTLSYVILPLIGGTLPLAMTGLFAIFLFVEFTIVSTMSLCTELVPDLRATMMSGFFAAVGIGRIIGAMMGGPIWLSGGILATGLVSAAVSSLALLAIVWGLKGWRKS